MTNTAHTFRKMVNGLRQWAREVFHLKPYYIHYTFRRELQYGYISVVLVYRNDKLIKEYNCGDRMKLEFIRGLMIRVLGKRTTEGVMAGYITEAHLYTADELF